MPADTSAPKLSNQASIGHHIRRARAEKSMTLAQLAAALQLDKGYLSKVERGLRAPSVATLLKISEALTIPASQLFGESLDEGAIQITRADNRASPNGDEGYFIEALTTGHSASRLEAFLLHPDGDFHEDHHADHAGEEFLFVIDGSIEIRFADRLVTLDARDSIQFPGYLQHHLRRTSQAASVLIMVSKDA